LLKNQLRGNEPKELASANNEKPVKSKK